MRGAFVIYTPLSPGRNVKIEPSILSVGVAVATERLLFTPHTHTNTHIPKSLCECWRVLRKGSHIYVSGGSLLQLYTAAQPCAENA